MTTALLNLLARCQPFHLLDGAQLAACAGEVRRQPFKRGQTVLRRGTAPTELCTYLIAGSAELRRSFFDRMPLNAGEGAALRPLDDLLATGGQVVAQADGEIALVNRELLDRLGAEQRSDYAVSALAEADFTEEFLISDAEVEVDWMSRFLQSPLAHQLPARNIQNVLAALVVRDAVKGETIIRRGETGDALYVLVRGMALVRTDGDGVFAGREFPLIAGDYFGEEALVADTIRSASVVMEADGAVAQLPRAAFDELVRPHLIPAADEALVARALLERDDGDNPLVLDVRLPVECRRSRLPNSRNIPIATLRAALPDLDQQQRVLVTAHGGRRSELAVFLLRQAGFDAYLLPELRVSSPD